MFKIKNIKEDKKGFTLIEVIIAIVVFSISLLALVPLLITSVSVDKDAFLKLKAQSMITAKIDELLSDEISLIADGEDSELDKGVTLTRTWTVTAGTGNLRTITVNVTYTINEQNKTVTIVVERGA